MLLLLRLRSSVYMNLGTHVASTCKLWCHVRVAVIYQLSADKSTDSLTEIVAIVKVKFKFRCG